MAKKRKTYDCVVVGSGPGGAPFAWKLASNGMNVLMLEAGIRYNPYRDYALDQVDWELEGFPKKNNFYYTFGEKQKLDEKFSSLNSWNKASGVVNQSGKRAYREYQQISGVGGTTLHFQGEAHRLNENAFRMKSLYGVAVDWPIDYKDLEPYYTAVEYIIGVAGPERIPYRPRSKPYPLNQHKLSYASQIIDKACGKLGIDLTANSVAILSELYRDTPPCNYCNGCTWGCPRKDKGSVDVTFIPLAEDTGRCEIMENITVERIELENQGGKKKAKGVIYYDKDGKENFVGAEYVAIACGAVQTPRLLLNSEIDQYGNVGRNFMETTFYSVTAMHPERLNSYRGIPIDSVIWDWNNPDPKRGFSGGLRLYPTVGAAHGPYSYASRYFNGWGDEFVKEVERWFGHAIGMEGIAEFLPNENTYVTIDRKMKDRFGYPVAKIQSFLGDSELDSLKFMSNKLKEILKESGADEIVEELSTYDIFSPTHVYGTCRMGKDETESVVDPSLRVHSISNLLITDASVFPTSGGGEAPSLTIEALSLRAADLLLKDIKRMESN